MPKDVDLSASHPTIQQLESHNYRPWAQELSIYLDGKGLLGVVTGTKEKPQVPDEMADWDLLTQAQKLDFARLRNRHGPPIVTGGVPIPNTNPVQHTPIVINDDELNELADTYDKVQKRNEKKLDTATADLEAYESKMAKAKSIIFQSVHRNL
ncbi:hypothetical protein BJ508DRAFT_324573 [Ascobolus immersus RN42]|uniref:Retrotransposon Copia-like N-terminal domain-containing protein n=2 Tax=Ascobolus immersus RN42 TaxID=1160509 RepID=A0A3N4IB11_ASCIM|nr:hypothetical protein BJ508DRAFT_324573 [Ascobolus immersus RN42]